MKTIIEIEAKWDNSHCYLDNVDYDLPGWTTLPDAFETVWEENKPYVTIEIGEDGNIISMIPCERKEAPPKLSNKPVLELQRDYALQLFALSIESESDILQLSTLYPEYKLNTTYQTGDIFRYGTIWSPDAYPAGWKLIS